MAPLQMLVALDIAERQPADMAHPAAGASCSAMLMRRR
jgi:3-hydroxy-3-methylglutaryl CoA synthase